MIGSLQNKITKYQDKVAYVLPRAFGGTITYDGDYATHTFLTSGTFSVLTPGKMEITMVGGGSGGRYNNVIRYLSGGGGGGQVLHYLDEIPAAKYSVIIGAGGAENQNGGNTYFGSVCASGGYINTATSYLDGGVSGSGYVGGQGVGAHGAAGGGGGASGIGQNSAAGGVGGDGGSGLLNYGGGGGGAARNVPGHGMNGGGDGACGSPPSSPISAATDASANTGGGGGGGLRMDTYSFPAGSGGSGIVIIKYKYK